MQKFLHSFLAYKNLIKITMQYIVERQNNKHTANNAENIFYNDKALIISWTYQCNCTITDYKKERYYPEISVLKWD